MLNPGMIPGSDILKPVYTGFRMSNPEIVFFGFGTVRAQPPRRVVKMVECVWALPRPAGQTGKGGVGFRVLLSYSKAAFSIGLSGLQKKTAHFFLGARRRAVAFAYSKWIPRFGTIIL